MLKFPFAVALLPQAAGSNPLTDAPAAPPAVLSHINCAIARSCEATVRVPIATPAARPSATGHEIGALARPRLTIGQAARFRSLQDLAPSHAPFTSVPCRLSGITGQASTVEKWADFR
jgi:hypothetical protein